MEEHVVVAQDEGAGEVATGAGDGHTREDLGDVRCEEVPAVVGVRADEPFFVQGVGVYGGGEEGGPEEVGCVEVWVGDYDGFDGALRFDLEELLERRRERGGLKCL